MLFGAKKNKIAALEAEIDSLQKKLRDAEATIADQKAKLVELKGQEGAAVGADEATQRVEVERSQNQENTKQIAEKKNTSPQMKYVYKAEITRKALKIIAESNRENIKKTLNMLNKTAAGVSFASLDPQIRSMIESYGKLSAKNSEKYIIIDSESVDLAVLAGDANARKRFYEVEVAAIRRSEEIKRQKQKREDNSKEWEGFLQALNAALDKNEAIVVRRFRAAYVKDEYGNVVKDKRDEEVDRFLAGAKLVTKSKKHDIKKIRQYIKRWTTKRTRALDQADTVPDNGHDFEHWVAARLKGAGWTASVTQASGDDGVDVIAERGGLRVAVQCKRFKGSVGNKAVQEVYSGMKHMQLDRSAVITTGKYTKAAQDLASTTGVLLLREHDIPHMWDLLRR